MYSSLFFSLQAWYMGTLKKKVVKENDICKPLGIYAALKLSGETIIKAYNQFLDCPIQ